MTLSEPMSGSGLWETVFQKSDRIVSRKVAGEVFIVPVSGSIANMQQMFALTEAAEFIWDMLDGKRNLGEIRDTLMDTFEAEKTDVDSDIQEFVEDLMKAELIHEAGVIDR